MPLPSDGFLFTAKIPPAQISKEKDGKSVENKKNWTAGGIKAKDLHMVLISDMSFSCLLSDLLINTWL